MARTLIIGYGNPLRSDDGFGCYAAGKLSTLFHCPEVEVIARQQLTPELAEVASHFERIIFIDAARNCSPGKLRCEAIAPRESAAAHRPGAFTHCLTPAALVALTTELYGQVPEACYICGGGECFAPGETISPLLKAAFEPLLAQIEALLHQSSNLFSRVKTV
jgi:hydrogenase maturation protease